MEDKLPLIVLFLWVAIITIIFFVHLYGDKSENKMMRAAAFTNGWKLDTLFPQYRPNFLIAIPISMRPVVFACEVLYVKSVPLGIR